MTAAAAKDKKKLIFLGGLGVELFGCIDLFFLDENSGAQFERHDRQVVDEGFRGGVGHDHLLLLVVVVFLFFFFGGVFVFHAFGDAPELGVEETRRVF